MMGQTERAMNAERREVESRRLARVTQTGLVHRVCVQCGLWGKERMTAQVNH
jgi:hypothetical protein